MMPVAQRPHRRPPVGRAIGLFIIFRIQDVNRMGCTKQKPAFGAGVEGSGEAESSGGERTYSPPEPLEGADVRRPGEPRIHRPAFTWKEGRVFQPVYASRMPGMSTIHKVGRFVKF